LVLPVLALAGGFVVQGHAQARQQHRLAAQQVQQLGPRQHRAVEVAAIGPDAHRGAAAPLAAGQRPQLQRLEHRAVGKHHARLLPVALAANLEPPRQRIGHAHAHPVQPARKAVGPALPFVKLAARVQAREHQLQHRRVFFRVQPMRDAAPVVLDADRAVGVQGQAQAAAKTGQRLVGGVVDHLLHDVQRVVGAGVHARALAHRLQTLEDTNRAFGIGASRGRRAWGSGGRHGGGL